MACNCEGKKYNIGMGCCTPVLAPIENYYTKWQVDDLIESATTSGCCITPEEVDEKIESAKTEIEAEIPSLSGYATEQWVLDQNYITGVDLSNYATKSEIPTVPTSNTAFTNDAGYITEHQSLSAYSTTDEVNSAIAQAVSGKQNTLISGTNIKTINNESILGSGNIEIEGGGKAIEAGRGISVTTGETADTVSFSLPISAGTGVGSLVLMTENCEASGRYSYAEGVNTHAIGNYTHTEGGHTQAYGQYSHTEGRHTIASGETSHAEGEMTEAYGQCSHTEGDSTITNNKSEHASGSYNVSSSASTTFGDSGNTLFSVGNGRNSGGWPIVINRHNALDIRQNGDIYIADTSGSGEYYEKPMIKLQDALSGGGGTGTTYTAGDGISISNQNVISTTTKFWCGDEAAYNQIAIKDPNTVYMIHS